MKTRGIFYVLFLVLLLSLSGAQGCPKEETEAVAGVYIGGVSGLDASFVPGEPPVEVLDNKQEAFYITLSVENFGEFTVPKGKVIATLSGINKDDFGMKSLNIKSKSEIYGVSRIGTEVIEGGFEEMQFDEAKYKPDLPADFTLQLRADVCYAYQTDSLTRLCLKKNPLQRREEDVCDVTSEFIVVDNSGAPLQISDVKSVGAGVDSVIFKFVVENMGAGVVYEDNAFTDKCEFKQDKKDKVNVKVKSPSGKLDIKCGILSDKDYGVVRLIDGRKTVSCNIKTSGLQETAFEEPLEVVLNYFYKDSVGTGFTVVDFGY